MGGASTLLVLAWNHSSRLRSPSQPPSKRQRTTDGPSRRLPGIIGGISASGAASSCDWQCPDSRCINHTRLVFTRKTNCPKCGTPKPSATLWAAASGPGFTTPTGVLFLSLNKVAAPVASMVKVASLAAAAAAGDVPIALQHATRDDWQCPTKDCRNHSRLVFGRHLACPICHAPRAVVEQAVESSSPTTASLPGAEPPSCSRARRLRRNQLVQKLARAVPSGGKAFWAEVVRTRRSPTPISTRALKRASPSSSVERSAVPAGVL